MALQGSYDATYKPNISYLIYFHVMSLILCVPKFMVFNLSIEKIMPWDPCSYLIHYINWLRFQRG